MIKRWLVISLTCLSLIFVQWGQISAVSAEQSGRLTYEMPLTSTNISLSGALTTKQLYFQIPTYWSVQDVTLMVDYEASPLALKDRSSITLKINGTYLNSFRPSTEEGKQHIAVTIPKALVMKGSNNITIEGTVQTFQTKDEVCVNENWQDNWLQMYSTSHVAIQHFNEAPQNIREFHTFFTGLDIMDADQSAIVLPGESNTTELEAAVYALTGLSKSSSNEDKPIPFLSYGTNQITEKKAIAVVSLYDHLPSDIKAQLAQQDLQEKALIQLLTSEKQSTLVVTSQNPDLLVKAGKWIANQDLIGQLNKDIKIVNKDTDVDTPAVSMNRTIELTANGDTLKGWRHQEQTYFVSQPVNRSIADASKISVDFRYAQNLDFERSMITVLVNDKPIGSKKLTTALANGDQVTLPIPKNLNISGNFTITIAFDLELKNAYCYRNEDQMPWAFITKDTILQLNTTEKTELLFNNYPYPFIRDGNFNRMAVVIPKQRDNYTYQTISNIFSLLGQYTDGNRGEIHFYEDKAPQDVLDRNIIAIGTYENNELIRSQNNSFYFQFRADGTGFLSNEKMSIDDDYGARAGTLQLMDSPYKSGHALLAVTASRSESYFLASKLIASKSAMWKIYGDGVIADKDGKVNSYRFKKQADDSQPTLIDKLVQREDVLGFTVAFSLVLLLVLVALVLIVRKYRKKRGEGR
ncbi:cellulose biosynthesis cyclic di-GMP-binding regulatory protein BcsB [Paenibacillus selenitireducens]|uniref:cellulose biosynthesis cyclic di-GMP-binding regulatory protein BcsB n=1 Tax=Paenibacillus selenitireducens TaxID=1324314 RepID=UPI00117D5768|nr:cellulose biosynthesis cyclic di-GMP-binding regulatory protein BcsB [Paenibacillus selenitireducens]